MKKKCILLDVDYIGGQEPLTREEERIISEHIKLAQQRSKQRSERKKPVPKISTGIS